MSRRREQQQGYPPQQPQSMFGPMSEFFDFIQQFQEMGAGYQKSQNDTRVTNQAIEERQAMMPYDQVQGLAGSLKGLSEQSGVPGFDQVMQANQGLFDQAGIPQNTFPMLDDNEYMTLIAQSLTPEKKRQVDPGLIEKLMGDRSQRATILRNKLGYGQ